MKKDPKIFITSLGILAAAVMMLAATITKSFAAPDRVCRSYAQRAVDQQRENLRRRCGLRGRPWSANVQGHYNWCRGVARGVAWGETLNRMNALGLCRAGGGGGAATDRRCRQYAEAAVRQHMTNRRNSCGYRGRRWSDNFSGHYGWCRSVNQSFASSETLARGRDLRRCLNRASACRWRNVSFGQRVCECVFVSDPNVTKRVHPRFCSGLR